ncbi:isoafricanol synthase [Streptomyces palmae]|uniref:Terpene synthase n=1 Tax=Streptomyces palmae TaxID=1701085 RepID=A0A4Z0HAB5_9ACTN|nr:isoafricanol synthase [Streptomyces palmae]TGB09811.1 pentalenene synthase [Streptomyces palmae]
MNTTIMRPWELESDLTRRAELLAVPVGTAASPDGESARRHTIGWLRGFGVFRGDEAAVAEYDALRLDRLSALFYPQAVGAELALANDLNGWFFVFDDQFDGELGHRPQAVARLVDSVVRITQEPDRRGPVPGDSPLLASFRDLWRRINSGMPEVWRNRFRTNWCGYVDAHKREAADRTGPAPHSLDALLAVKRHSVGVQPCLDLHERFGGYALPDAVHTGFPLARMREATDDVVIFINDIVSLDKELAAGDVHNSVLLHRGREGGTLEQAVRHVAGLANARYRYFEELAAQLPGWLGRHGAGPELIRHTARYADGMRHVMAGSLAWSLETSRYDARGVAAAGSGRLRPWADLGPLGEPAPGEGTGRVG